MFALLMTYSVLLVIISYVCVFCVDNPVLTSRVAVTVHVLDINEFPPELAMPHETFVCESAKVGQVSEYKWLCVQVCMFACPKPILV